MSDKIFLKAKNYYFIFFSLTFQLVTLSSVQNLSGECHHTRLNIFMIAYGTPELV